MSDLISRADAIDALEWKWAGKAALDAIKALPSAEHTAHIGDFTQYQIDWLISHDDLELEPELESWVIRFLKDTADCYEKEYLPSAERVGHWVEHLDMHPLAKEESKYVCSCCGWRTRQVEGNGHLVGGYGAEAIGAEWVCTEWEDLFYKYCPNCGARMVSEDD